MMHPVMPHITEELYSHLPIAGKSQFLMSAPWPTLPDSFDQPAAEAEIEQVFELVRTFRALRADLDLAPMKPIPLAYIEGDLQGNDGVFASQAWVQEVRHGRPDDIKLVSSTVNGIDLHLPISGLVDTEKELARLKKDEEKTLADLAKTEARLANPQFTERAKPEVVEREQAALAALHDQLRKLEERRKLFDAS